MIDQPEAQKGRTHFFWFTKGLKCLFSIPALILLGAFIGFTSLAKEAGFTLAQTEFMIATIWALPAKVVLVSAVGSKATLLTTFLAVCLSSVRLLPMVVAIVPEMKVKNTRKITLYILSHFVAVTAWVMALERFKLVPKEFRTSFFAGLVCMLLVSNMLVASVTFQIIGDLHPIFSAALIFVTPLYFLFSMWGTTRERTGNIAMIAGLLFLPLFHAVWPHADILAAGIVGGVCAYWWGKQSDHEGQQQS